MSSETLERRLGLAAVVAISISAMLGSGIFVLPGLAAAKTGPLVWLAYLVAGLTVLPAALSKAELATAMPTSGGTYVYLERTFGPLAGTISGLGLWLSLLLKSAFALVGFGAYLSVLVGMEMTKYNLSVVALILLVAITILNIMGVGIISKMQKFILSGVLLALLALSIKGLGTMRPEYLEEGMTKGFSGFLAATAFVYVSYAGVTKVAAIAEEVKNPERNLPWGILISWFTVMSIYVFVVYVLVANVSQDQLTHSGMGKEGPPDLHPVYTLANIVAGPVAGTVAAVLAVITMVSMAVAGLLAASRFPFAMSRDSLLPKVIKNISPKFKTPLPAILLTAFVMAFSILFLPIEKIAKLASAFMILAYMLECGTVLVLRESASRWYQPGFRSPLYPGMQILGIAFGLILLYALGLTSVFAIGCIVIVGAILYFCYGCHQTSRRGEMGKMGPRRDLLAGNSVHKEGAAPVIQDASSKAAVIVPLFGSERSPETLVEMGASLAHGRRLEVLHLTVVQEETNDEDAPDAEPRTHAFRRRIKTMADVEGVQLEYDDTVTRDIVGTIHQVATRSASEWVVMEAAERRRFGITFQNPLGWLQDHLACNLAVFKDAGVRYIRQILVYPEPGPHDSLVVTTADHLAQIHNAELNFICFEADDEDTVNKQAAADYTNELRGLCLSPTKVVTLKGADELESIQEATGSYDLLIMGAAPNRKLKARLWGSPKDNLTRHAECSVLWVKTAMQKPYVAFDVAKLPDEKEVDLLSFVDEKCILLNTDVTKKELLFRKATDLLAPRYPAISPIIITTALWEREQSQNTGVLGGWALPHATLAQAANSNSAIAIMTTKRPINYDTDTGEKVDVFFFTTGSPNNRQTHLRILAEISRLCQQTDFLDQARKATSNSEIMESLRNCLMASPSP